MTPLHCIILHFTGFTGTTFVLEGLQRRTATLTSLFKGKKVKHKLYIKYWKNTNIFPTPQNIAQDSKRANFW